MTFSPALKQDLSGRSAIVTGATGGLGLEVALGLARAGADVVLTGRDTGKGQRALDVVRKVDPKGRIAYEDLDLANLASVEAFAGRTVAGGGSVDILVNNAGVMAIEPRQTTSDGFEMQFGTNYLGHFALTACLLPALLRTRSEARVVNVASLAHRGGRIALDDLQAEHGYSAWASYRQSKLAMLMFGRELQRRAAAAGWPLRSVTAHPGWAYTGIIANGPGRSQAKLMTWLFSQVFRLRGQSAAAGALPMLYAASAPEAEPGGYYGPSGQGEIRGPVGPSIVMPQAADLATAERLWALSEELTGSHFPKP